MPLASAVKSSVSELPSAVQIRRHTEQLIRLPMMFGILLRLQLWAAVKLCGKFRFLCLFLRVNYKYCGSQWTAHKYSTGASLLAGDRGQVTSVYDFRTFMNFNLTSWWTWCLDVGEPARPHKQFGTACIWQSWADKQADLCNLKGVIHKRQPPLHMRHIEREAGLRPCVPCVNCKREWNSK